MNGCVVADFEYEKSVLDDDIHLYEEFDDDVYTEIFDEQKVAEVLVQIGHDFDIGSYVCLKVRYGSDFQPIEVWGSSERRVSCDSFFERII